MQQSLNLMLYVILKSKRMKICPFYFATVVSCKMFDGGRCLVFKISHYFHSFWQTNQ